MIKEFKQHLIEMRKTKEYRSPRGICTIAGDFGLDVEKFKKNFTTWPEYSGDINYPVAHSTLPPDRAYLVIHELWDPDTEYGAARWRLVEHLINVL